LIKALKVGEDMVQSPTDVRREVVNFFTTHTSLISWERSRLSEEQTRELVANFELGKIEKVVRDSDGNKSHVRMV
jgi:hypothetical protein